jgi:hypothetical protein
VLGQSSFARPDVAGLTLDVHWRASSRRIAAALFDFDDLWSRAVPLPRLGPHAFGPSATDALALACVHLVAHHQHDDVLLWLYDVHLLIEHFSREAARAFIALAVSRRMSRICVTVIERAAGAFHGRRAGAIVEALRDAAPDEPSARLAGPRTPLSDLLSDLAVMRAPGEGLRLVLAHLFPPAAYMRTAFAPSSRAPLPWLYARRIVRGSVGWLAPRHQRGSGLGLGQRPRIAGVVRERLFPGRRPEPVGEPEQAAASSGHDLVQLLDHRDRLGQRVHHADAAVDRVRP